MLTKERNDFLCRVGAGTPMGEAMRCFWWPVLLSNELPCLSDPVLVRLLGERFVAFRDGEGRVGILDELCSHRGASLTVGRVEDDGIRCVYHGWKFSAEGGLVHAPNVESKDYCQNVRHPSYPVHEAGGLIWVYIGPRDREPPFRHFPWMDLPASRLDIFGFVLPTNFLSELENHADGAHSTLHHDISFDVQSVGKKMMEDTFSVSIEAPPIRGEIEETEFGFYYAIIRDDLAGGLPAFTLAVPFILPTTVIPLFTEVGAIYIINVPLDDVTTLNLWVQTNTGEELPAFPPIWERLPEICEQMPGRLVAGLKINEENGYLQDRNSMRHGRYAGFLGRARMEDPAPRQVFWRDLGGPSSLLHQDLAILLTQGAYPTRSMEHCVPCDNGVLWLRQQLTRLAQDVAAGESPQSATADVTDVRGWGVYKAPWREILPESRAMG
jgi:nitrite reductase/ring-hydroxylating ferredoxin subunit